MWVVRGSLQQMLSDMLLKNTLSKGKDSYTSRICEVLLVFHLTKLLKCITNPHITESYVHQDVVGKFCDFKNIVWSISL